MAKRTRPGAAGDPDDARNVQSIEFADDQWAAITKAAYAEGHKPGPFIRAAALKRARELGFWRPFERPGPASDASDPDE